MTPQTLPVPLPYRLDEVALDAFLSRHLPEYDGALKVRLFPGGYSNPTYALQASGRDGQAHHYVLRKRPAGQLPVSAHRVDREFHVLRALQATEVPVPRVRILCKDETVLGTPFFVMERVQGRLFTDPLLPACTPAQRSAMYGDMVDVLARLHSVDPGAIGLGSFGKPGNFLARQVDLWTRQYRAAQTDTLPEMEALGAWLNSHLPAPGRTTLVHGDYRPNNLLMHPFEPRVAAILDWELSTVGDPLCDLAYTCFCYHIQDPAVGFGNADLAALGIPSEKELLQRYTERAGVEIAHWPFYMALQLYKSASILQGVYKRALEGAAPAAGLKKRDQVTARARLALDTAKA